MLKGFLSAIQGFTDRSGVISAFGVLALMGVLSYEVVARFVFDYPSKWSFETVSFMFGIYTILVGGAYCVVRDKHIRVDVFYARFSPKGKAIVDLATSGFSFIFIGALLWTSIPYAWHSFLIRQTSISAFAPPLYPFKIILAIGTFWLLLLLVVKLIRDIYMVKENAKMAFSLTVNQKND